MERFICDCFPGLQIVVSGLERDYLTVAIELPETLYCGTGHINNKKEKLGDEIYDAMLNQTNVGDNNNKFYVIKLLESDDGLRYMVYNRWGRLGIKGQDKLHDPYTSLECAIQEFEQNFFSKTKN
ncbi:hypothetical protein POM88_023585 [Heracleum sosnowskyi]|uniref:NAD(+) ADP-ribosyltransferase n=1 Tax=Heracleum sosnowskyi TaxID=360622 RepID=A0AAD8IHL2_9APIA|nr:hypothetical protein POM88_023585 [Heracleum sosnowskyi]